MTAPQSLADWSERIAPMMAELAEAPFDSSDHLFEVKWDGIRAIARVEPGGVGLHNRRRVDITARYPELAGLAALPAHTMVDGEIVVLEEGKPSFSKIMQRQHVSDARKVEVLRRRLPVTFMVFDVLFEAGHNVMNRPLRERRERLASLLGTLEDVHIVMTDHVLEQGRAYFSAAEQFGLEGTMAKRLDSPYWPGRRSSHWLKIKVAKIAEFDIIGFTARGEHGPISALLLGSQHRGRLIYKGRVGSGFSDVQRQALFEALQGMPVMPDPPPGGPGQAAWRVTHLRGRVKYLEKTTAGMLRGPVFLGMVSP